MEVGCFRCRFTLDLHVQPWQVFVATATPAKNDLRLPVQQTIGAAWPLGSPKRSVVFLVKYRGTLSSDDMIEFNVSRTFLTDFRLEQNLDYCFKELQQCPTLTCVVLEGDADAIQEARDPGWLSTHCESLVHEGCRLGRLTVKHVIPYSFGVLGLSTRVVFIDTKRNDESIERRSETCDDVLHLRPLLEPNIYKLVEKSLMLAMLNADGDRKFDIDRCAFVSSGLMTKLGLAPFCWARLKTEYGSRQVRIVPTKTIPELDNVGVQVTWQLLFNVSSYQHVTPCEIEQIELDVRFASDAAVSLVLSPSYPLSGGSAPIMLQHHFKKARLLSVGDVFAVCTEKLLRKQPQLKGFYDNLSTQYFTVRSLPDNRESMWVQRGRSTVVERAEVTSTVPAFSKVYPPYHAVFNTPQSVFGKVNDIVRVVKLFFAERSATATVRPLFLISGPSNSGKTIAVQTIARGLGLHLRTVNGDDLTGETAATAEIRIKNSFEKLNTFGGCLLHLKNIDVMFEHVYDDKDTRLLNSLVHWIDQIVFDEARQSNRIAIVMTTTNPAHIPSKIMALVLQHVKLADLDEAERTNILRILLSERRCSSLVDLKTLASLTAGFVLGDLVALSRFAQKCTRSKLEKVESPNDADLCGPLITMDDAMTALKEIQIRNNKSIGAPQIPSVKWADVGGLEEAKKNILDTIQFPLKHPQFAQSNLTRSGVLLYGPPGTGKTLLAKAVATECSLNFLSVKGPELINMYVGQSEENVRRVFEKARSVAPCIIFFDELDSLAPNRGRSADSGGVLDRVVSQLLAEMDGLSKSKQIFVIGATNRPDLLDSAVLRPGRLDRLIYVDIPEEPAVKLKVLQALTRKMKLNDVDLKTLSERCPKTYTGADLYSLCATAMTAALSRCIATGQTDIVLSNENFCKALDEIKPSVGDVELARYRNLKKQFQH